jgi:hypothetical protein
MATSSEQALAVKSLGGIPLIVLTAAPPNPGWEGFPVQVQASLNATRQGMQKELVGLSTNGKQIISSSNEHSIHEYAPQEVVAAILELVQMSLNR